MKTKLSGNTAQGGYALVLVLGFTAVGMIFLGAMGSWTSTNSNLVDRNNQYYRSVAAAEAATEHVVAEIAWDFQNSGEGVVSNNMAKYRGKNPKTTGHPKWAKYKFSNGKNQANSTFIESTSSSGFTNLASQYEGLYGMVSTYRVISNAEEEGANPGIIGAIGQEIQLATIPIFQFAIFSSMDLEINPGQPMVVNGRVHANQNIYMNPSANLTYKGDVTSGGQILHNKKPGDPQSRSMATITYEGEHDSGVNSLTLPIGTNNSPAEVRKILDIPPQGEKHDSLLGQQRYYNKADLIIVVKADGKIDAHGSVGNGKGPTLKYSDISSFVKTNLSFNNNREGKTIKGVTIDVAALKTFAEGKGQLQSSIKDDRLLNCVYVKDERNHGSSAQPGIKVINGDVLPADGLTIATPNPLYVEGHFNAPPGTTGTKDTSKTKPASLVADAITVLSESWKDANSGSMTKASVTTVNAAFLAGNVETIGGYYSGGAENFPRFLEDWDKVKFTYNGSMVIMFQSSTAKAPWGPPSDYYKVPSRDWGFDLNFLDPKKLPPGTPAVRTMIRAGWGILPPNNTTAKIKKHGKGNDNGNGNGNGKGNGKGT